MNKIIKTLVQYLFNSYRCGVKKTKNHSRIIQLRAGISAISFIVIRKWGSQVCWLAKNSYIAAYDQTGEFPVTGEWPNVGLETSTKEVFPSFLDAYIKNKGN